ncbi:alpha/beta hydrolase YcfP [Parashewanella tropica]|uniref:alpha/beta hydrolase YcfP n=1 Tax=Parashewanella tropica TaxID=2547970 RepID=UPI00105A9231|nr:alpha/beta hydrolase YcfP [Parashewanella tropica]
MILYFHGFDSTSPGNHEKIRQLQFIDKDVRLISYSTEHPKHDMQHLLNEVAKQNSMTDDPSPLLIGVGLGGYWVERIGFLAGIKSIMINPNLSPEITMLGRIDRPEEYADIANKCVSEFRRKNAQQSLCILSKNDEILNSGATHSVLSDYYNIIWDEEQGHKFPSLSAHLNAIKAFKLS